jgi:hypothetical protein
MNPEHTRLRQEEQTSSAQSLDTSQQHATEFATVEELLRHDSEQNAVPIEVAERLNRSIAAEPKPARSWFKKLFN